MKEGELTYSVLFVSLLFLNIACLLCVFRVVRDVDVDNE